MFKIDLEDILVDVYQIVTRKPDWAVFKAMTENGIFDRPTTEFILGSNKELKREFYTQRAEERGRSCTE